jgi:hypothetical protein
LKVEVNGEKNKKQTKMRNTQENKIIIGRKKEWGCSYLKGKKN